MMTAVDLIAASAQLDISLSQAQVGQLTAYLSLIQKWNKVYNLTAVRNPEEMVTHHLLDSLAAIAPLEKYLALNGLSGFSGLSGSTGSATLLDVGSGAGLPGVVIAICCPSLAVTCVDTVAKKATFIKQVALELKLPNLAGLHARVENVIGPFNVVCSRAFASLPDFTQWSTGALSPSGVWMAMKGKHPEVELAALPENIDVFHVEQLIVPGLNADRCIVWMRKKSVS